METLDLKVKTPLYLQLKEVLARSLLTEQNKEGKLPTLKEIAERYKVSVVTAVKAVEKLKAEGLIYGKTAKGLYLKDREKLLELYLPRSRTKTIGVTFLDIYNTSNPYLSEVIRGLSEGCRNLNLNLQIFTTPSTNLGTKENPLFWENIRKNHLDGLILASRMPVRDIVLLQQEGIPFVWIANDLPGEDIHCVIGDKFSSLNILLGHLAKLNYRRIAFLSGEEIPEDRSAFNALSSSFNLQGRYYWQEGQEEETGYLLTKEAISKYNPEALITRGLELTSSALTAISELNLSIPQDIALIALVSSLSTSFFPHNISVLYGPVADMAKKALQMLDDILNGVKITEKKTVVPEQFMIRGSCGFPMAEERKIIISDIEELKTLSYPERISKGGEKG